MSKFRNIAVYGGGSWGCALACQAARTHANVELFLRDKEIIREILSKRTNNKYLGDIILPNNINPSDDLTKLAKLDLIIICVPSRVMIETLEIFKKNKLPEQTVLLIATKGIIGNPVALLSERIKQILPNPIAFIAGPNFAKEVAKDLLTYATIAAEDIKLANNIAESLASENFIISTTNDIITVQIAGAVKNIIAIAGGIHEALSFEENAKAGLVTEGLREIMLLAKTLGGKCETMTQPAVVGDLILTCYSKTSRNTRFGYELTRHPEVKRFLMEYPYLVEGVESAGLIMEWARQYKLDLPVVGSVAKALKLDDSSIK